MRPVATSLAKQLGLSTSDVGGVVELAEHEARTGRFREAIETLRVAIVLDPIRVTTWDKLADCFDRVGDASRSASASRVAAKMRAQRATRVAS